ncbi:Helix-turn-helix domain protein [compost metagenome]
MYQITLRAARINRGFTVEEVAKNMKKSPKTISKYEEDSTSIPRNLLSALIEMYRIPEELVYCGKESVFIGFTRKVKRKRKVS